jgi:tetratricopeptide (TPR) repeat protein
LNKTGVSLAGDPALWYAFVFEGTATQELIDASTTADMAFTSALDADPTNDGVWNNRAWAEFAIGHRESAFECLKMAQKLSPSDPVYYVTGALFQLREGNASQFENSLERAVASEPELLDSELIVKLSNLKPAWVMQSMQGALTLLSGRTQDPLVMAKEARILYSLNNLPYARRKLEAALQMSPGMVNAWGLLAVIQERTGRLEEADRTLSKIRAINSGTRASQTEGGLDGSPLTTLGDRNARFYYRYRSRAPNARLIIPTWLPILVVRRPLRSYQYTSAP